jgi:hypothetical protein
MSYLEAPARKSATPWPPMNSDYLVTIIVKSTVPAGTNRKLYNFLKEQTKAHVQVVSNPEFLREGSAVQDFLNARPHRHRRRKPRSLPHDAPPVRSDREARRSFMTMNWESAELTKYAANSMLAARISFMNEMTILCEGYGADVEDIRKGIGSDARIGPAFLKAGCGYGGSCFPKDVAAMEHISGGRPRKPVRPRDSETNANQKKRFAEKIVAKLGRPIAGRHDRRLGPGVQSRHRRHPRIGRHRRDPLSARQRRARPRPRPQGDGNMKQVFKDEVEWCPTRSCRRRRRCGGAADRLAAVHARCRSARSRRR